MFLKSLKCYGLFLIATLAMVLAFTHTRETFLNFPYFYIAVGYLIGASIWLAVPGLINFWLHAKRGYLQWGMFSLVTGISIIGLACLCFSQASGQFIVTIAGIMTVPVTIGQLLVLRFGMKIQMKNDDREAAVVNVVHAEVIEPSLEELVDTLPDDEEAPVIVDSYRRGE